MLNRQNRLKTKDFKELKKGSNVLTPLFKCKIITDDSYKSSKLATTITKKILKRSIDRNRLKRKICYAYRELNLDKTNNTYIIQAIFRENSKQNINYKQIKNSLKNLCGIQ